MTDREKLGHILIEKKILTPLIVARMVAIAKQQNQRLGWVLEARGIITGEELATVLAQQFNMEKISNLAERTFSQESLQIFTAEFAFQERIFPLSLNGKKLELAITDPTDMKIIENFAVNNGLQIIPFVASRKEIYAAICKYYFGKEINESRKNTILIVEDDTVTQNLYREVLQKLGYTVLLANDGMEGFKEVITQKPRIVITDKEMSKLDGFAMLKSIKAIPELRSIPVILVSGKMTDKDEAQVFKVGFFDYITKPVKVASFIARIERALNYYQIGDGL